MTGIMITPDDEPDRDPDEEIIIEHPDSDEAEYEDEHGPAFRTSYDAEAPSE